MKAATLTDRIAKAGGKLRVRLHAQLPGAGRRAIMTRYGVWMRENQRDRTFLYCRYGIYGRAFSSHLEQREAPFAFVDIGANQGLYSLIAAGNPQCRNVLAFEPVSATFALLCDNIDLNGAGAIITPVQAAVSEARGTALIAVDPKHSGKASLRASANGRGEEVRTIGPDELYAALPGDVPLIIKIDVEGHEQQVITALLASSSSSAIAEIFYEVDRRWTDPEAIEALLRQAGFRHFTHIGVGRHFDVLASR